MKYNNTIEQIDDAKCTGCMLCKNICPTGAISIYVNHEGFQYPRIEINKCIKCGLCYDKCVVNDVKQQNIKPNEMLEGYASWTKDQAIRLNSTSGGVYYALAKAAIDNGWYICGCSYNSDNSSALHIIGNDIKTLKRTMRSKYFQSEINDTYLQVKELISKGNKIFFVGAPCQVEAVRTVCEDSSNLITCDFICRGVNSPKAFNVFIKGMEEKYRSKITHIHFKNKRFGWTLLSTKLIFENGKYYYGSRTTDPWINGYITGHLYMRKSCYSCKYANTNRYGDLTIGDFWGEGLFDKDELYAGVSCVSINSNKGKELYEMASGYIWTKNVSIDKIIRGNGCLSGAYLEIPVSRKEFFEKCDIERFDKLVYRLLGWSNIDILKRKIKNVNLIRRNLKANHSKELSKLIVDDMEDLKNGNSEEN